MKAIRLDQWALSILNETIRADAGFQVNQRSAWQEFAREPMFFNGVDITAGMQHQRNLVVQELTFGFELLPARPGFFERLIRTFGLRRAGTGQYYRLARPGEVATPGISVKIIVSRDAENRYRSDLKIEPGGTLKPEEIHVAGITG